MTITPGPWLNDSSNRPEVILPGMVVSCSSPNLSNGTVRAHSGEDWGANVGPANDLVYVDFGAGGKVWVQAARCTVTG
jgi:hypothetical protein